MTAAEVKDIQRCSAEVDARLERLAMQANELEKLLSEMRTSLEAKLDEK